MPVSTLIQSGIHRIAGWRWKPKAPGFERLVAADTPSGEFYGIEIFAGILPAGQSFKRYHGSDQTREK